MAKTKNSLTTKQTFNTELADNFLGFIDLRLLIARHATSLLYGEGIKLSSADPKINEFLRKWSLESRLQLTLEKIEQVLSAQGRAVVTIDKSATGHIWLTIANPPMLNKVGRVFVQENSAVVWKRIFFDDRMFWSRQTYDTEKVVTQIYGGGPIPNGVNSETPIDENTTPFNANGEANLNNLVTIGHVAKIMAKLKLVPVWYHNLGVCPLVELFNLPDYLFDQAYVGHNPDLRAENDTIQTSLTNLINIYNESLITTQPRVLISANPQSQQILDQKVVDNNPVLGNLFIQHSAVGENGQTLIDVIQSKIQAQDYIGAIHQTISLAYFTAGYNYDGNPNKNDLSATGSILGRERDIQTTKRKRNYRMLEISRLIDKVLIVKGLMKPDSERPFTFEIKTNILINTLVQSQTQEILLRNKITSRQDAIAVIHGLSQSEALEKKKAIDKELQQDAPLYEKLLQQTAPVETKNIIQKNAEANSENRTPERKRTPSDFQKGAGS